MKRLTIPTALLTVTIAIASPLYAAAPPTTQELIAQAEATRKEAAAIGYEWRNTAQLIKQANDALTANNEPEAQKLASAALLEAEQAVKQGKWMQANWQTLIPTL
uniref:SoxXA-binding protein SoxK n=1 Tax=Chlorobium chlorochromatii (strain CaD3) TaxID=340177 RepID=Q3APA1_CHLCH